MERVINKDTLVPLGAVVTVFLALLGAHSFWTAKANELATKLDSIDRRLERIEEHQIDRWTLTDMRLWVAAARQANPTLTLPEPQQARPVSQPRRR